MKHFIAIEDLTPKEFQHLINKAETIKKNPVRYARALYEKTLLMIFEAPSLRTRLSFEAAMTQLHGQAINYYTQHSPWGMGKETIEDVAKVVSRYCDVVMARIYSHTELKKLARNSSIPVINAMTNNGHPCQIIGDFLTIKEKLGSIKNIKIAYCGDARNNVTYSLMEACALTGNSINIACPKEEEYAPDKRMVERAKKLAKKHKGSITITHNPGKAVKNADVIYTDSWMSYRIPKEEKEQRMQDLKPFQVNRKLFRKAKKTTVFMHCLPAWRTHEVTKDIIDGPRSIVFDQAENRLHIQKALLLELLGK